MRCRRSRDRSPAIPLIDRAPINPLDPIAHSAAVARSAGQGRRSVFRVRGMSSDDARPENASRRRSLALERSEHDGKLMAVRDGGFRATLSSIIVMLSACSVIACSTADATAEPPFASPATRVKSAAPSRDPWAAHIAEAAKRFAIPERWIRAVMAVESTGNRTARSPKGAMGLMQIMPATWAGLRDRYRLGADPYDPHDNIIAGAAYIRLLYDRYGSPGWIAAYNAGPGRYEASLRGHPLPPETRAYVAAVAPNLDGAGDPGVTMVAAIDPLAWTRSALFVTQQTSKPAADSIPTERPSSDAPVTPIVRDVSAIVPQSNGLFVARANGGTAQWARGFLFAR